MIKITIEIEKNDNNVVRKDFSCPNCGATDWFYGYSPQLCERCKSVFPNIADIAIYEHNRIRYYIKGI